MPGHRIHIFGASGAGTSTLGRALADALASQHFDTDDFYWVPTDPPFCEKRPIPERRALMQQVFLPRRDWVLSGSIDSWSDGIADRFTHAVFLELDTDLRMDRLRSREMLRFPAAPDPEERAAVDAFLDWARHYDSGSQPGRSRPRHDAWMVHLACPVQRLDAAHPIPDLVTQVVGALDPGNGVH